MTYKTLVLERRGAVAYLRLNRPDAANAIDLALGRELVEATAALDCDAGVRAVVLTGNGKMFCAGGDLAAFASFGDAIAEKLKVLTADLHVATSRLLRMRAPVIVAVNGVAAGAGMSLAAAGDLVVASDKARFTMAYTKAGLTPDGGASFVLPRLVGLRRTQELMLTNRMLSAQEALEWGLVTKVVPHEELEAQVSALAEELAAGPTDAFGGVKRLLVSSAHQSLETQMELESREITSACATADGREGIAAFLEKRAAQFRG